MTARRFHLPADPDGGSELEVRSYAADAERPIGLWIGEGGAAPFRRLSTDEALALAGAIRHAALEVLAEPYLEPVRLLAVQAGLVIRGVWFDSGYEAILVKCRSGRYAFVDVEAFTAGPREIWEPLVRDELARLLESEAS